MRRRPPFGLAAWLYGITLLSLVMASATLILVSRPPQPPFGFLAEVAHFAAAACENADDPASCMRSHAPSEPGAFIYYVTSPDGVVHGEAPRTREFCGDAPSRIGRVSVCARPPAPAPHAVAVALALAALTSLLCAVVLTRRFVRPLARLTTAAQAVASGDLTARSGLEGHGEFAEVGRAFDAMVDDLRSLLDAEKELLASLSHELRTPLARISIALDLVSDGEEVDEQMLDGLRSDVRDLEELLQELLSAARLQLTEGRASTPLGRVPRGDVAIGSCIAAATESTRERFRGVQFEVLVEPDLPTLHGSESLLRRAVRNLLENAARVSEPGAMVTARASRVGTELVIEVVDHGPGIPVEDRERLFAPFVRGSAAQRSTGASAALGIGLTMVKRIVVGHGGSVALTAGDTCGTVATLRFPISAPCT